MVLVCGPRPDHQMRITVGKGKEQVDMNVSTNISPLKNKELRFKSFFINKRWYIQTYVCMTGTLLLKRLNQMFVNLLGFFWNAVPKAWPSQQGYRFELSKVG